MQYLRDSASGVARQASFRLNRRIPDHKSRAVSSLGLSSAGQQQRKASEGEEKIEDPLGALNGKQKSTAPDPQPQDRARWNIFRIQEYNRPWQVPWGKKETAIGLLLWILSFLLISLLTIPILVQATGLSVQELTAQQKTQFVLLNQVLETVIGIALIRYVVRGYQPLPEDVFSFSVRNPFQRPTGWGTWALLGIASAPLAVSLTETLFTAAGYTENGPSTVDEVVKILSPDTATLAGLFAVTAILAPILEEFVFRGFLLTSLTKFMPVPAAVLTSSVGFGLAHLSLKDLPELTVLGLLLGCCYIRSRNLLTPVLVHGLWNGTTLAALYILAQAQPS